MEQNHPTIHGQAIADCVTRFRAAKPHVHCITNSVAQHFTANVLLAAGATPSMTIAKNEVADFVTMADGLLVNLGTMDDARNKSVALAVAKANELQKPWALDPVFAHASPLRLTLAKELLQRNPTLVRCNQPEGEALFEQELNADTVQTWATYHDTTIVMTGKTDLVSSGSDSLSLGNGSSLMDRITAMGCALTALMVGFIAIERNHALASASAVSLFGIAGEFAQNESAGPGSFVAPFLDALANLTSAQIAEETKLL